MSILFDQESRLFHIETRNSFYQMKISDIGILMHTYYGQKIGQMDMSYQIPEFDRGFSGNPYEKRLLRGISLDLLPQEYSSTGVGDYRVSTIEVEGEDGSRSADFRYVGHKISDKKYQIPNLPCVREEEGSCQTLEIELRDDLLGLSVILYYGVFEDKDIITRAAVIQNAGEKNIVLNKASSMCMDFLNQKFDLIHFHGRHCMERQMERIPVTHDIHTIGSKRGMSSHHHNPFVILCNPNTTENQGNCYGFMMVYSGNHKTEVEMEQSGSTRVVMGIHDENFSWNLKPDEKFFTPEVILSYSANGLNALSQNYHRIIRENVCDPKYLNVRRPILINNWEATYFDFDADRILKLANQAKDLGVEMLVLDDGWFGERNDDNAGLGDWFVNEDKLKGGLGKLSKEITELGLKFGLWFEPEMINEASKLYQNHSEWVLCDPNRKPMMSRNQMVLDMANPDVLDYLYNCISAILNDAEISYIKWDFNRSVANVYSNAFPAERQGEVAHRFILGTYALLERITTNYPNVMIEGCAGGGGRFDAGMLYYSPQIWCSDDTDPIARVDIQKGTSYGYPVSTMGSHVSASPNHQTGRNTPLKLRGVVAMSGTFGYELDLGNISEEEKEEIKMQIQDFKKYYWLIQDGIYYRLDDNRADSFYEAWQFVSKDKKETLVNVVWKDMHANTEFPWVRLEGLDAEKVYQLEGTNRRYTGLALMHAGYGIITEIIDYPSVQLHFVEVEQ